MAHIEKSNAEAKELRSEFIQAIKELEEKMIKVTIEAASEPTTICTTVVPVQQIPLDQPGQRDIQAQGYSVALSPQDIIKIFPRDSAYYLGLKRSPTKVWTSDIT